MLLLMLGGTCAFAQGDGGKATVSGLVVDGDDQSPVMQATVQVLSLPDSTMVVGNVTDMNGRFSVSTKPGKYLLKVSFVGYTSIYKPITLGASQSRLRVGKLELQSDAIMLEGAVVVGQAPEVTAVADTLVYNSSAYRVPEGSALEELVKKLPGAEVSEDGKITINGKEIKKIMVDGKEFFADDPNIAMKNLPVNIIDKVRAYEKQSDMARMTGVDDGEEETVLDLSVKPGMNKGWFGNVDVAGGTKERYSGKLLANYIRGKNQFTVIGSMNNVNDNSYPGGGGGFRRPENGLTAIKMAGINFATETQKLLTEGSVNFNYKDADMVSKQSSETFVSSATSSFKNALDNSRNKTTNLVGDFRIEWRPDTMTNILFRPRISYGKTDNANGQGSYTFNADPEYSTDEIFGHADITDLMSPEDIVNRVIRNSLKKGDDLTLGGSLLVNRKLGKAGRSITFRGQYNYTNSSSEQFSTSETKYYQVPEEEVLEILNRYQDMPTKTSSYSARITYSEPIFKGGFLQLTYNFQYKHSDTDNSTYDMPNDWTVGAGYHDNGTFNASLSKSATYNYYNHQANVALLWVKNKMRLNAGLSFQPQRSTLSYQKGDYNVDTVRTVFNFTPTLDFRYKFSKTSQLRIRYRGRSSQPSMTDLLPIRDDSDPLNVRVGNPGLKPAFTNMLFADFNTFNTETQRGMFSFVNFQNQQNSISNRKVYDPTTGGYTTTPENINGNWSLFGIVGANIALKNKRYTFNTFTRANYQNMVAYISEENVDADKNTTKRLLLGERIRGTYRNDWLEVSLNGSLDYTHSRNTYQERNDMDTYQFSYGASTNINLPWNMVISTDISQNSRRGYADASMNRDELVWNAQISQNFLKGNAATVSLQFYDILHNQSNISRTITAAMRQDIEYNSIFSYCMLHFIYRLNTFGGKGGMRGGPGFGGPGHGPGGRPGGRRL